MNKSFYEKMWKTIKTEKKPFKGEIKNKRKNGEIYYAISTVTPLTDEKGTLSGFIGVEEDITKLKEIDKMKDDFLSITSHELRTPLTAVKWYSERLLNKELNKDNLIIVNKIEKENQKMIDLVNSLLNISRIESGRLIINSVLTNMSKLVDESLEDAKMKYFYKNQSFNIIKEPNLPEVKTDPKLVGDIMINLLTNAMKYSPENTEVSIHLFIDEKFIIFEVADHGYGIPKDEQKMISTRFFRGKNILSKVTIEGTGLGLYLSYLITKAISGKLSFTSKENQGSIFQLAIPIAGNIKIKGKVSLQEI